MDKNTPLETSKHLAAWILQTPPAGQDKRYREEARFEETEVTLSLFQHLKELTIPGRYVLWLLRVSLQEVQDGLQQQHQEPRQEPALASAAQGAVVLLKVPHHRAAHL